jgi:hypothetical protein
MTIKTRKPRAPLIADQNDKTEGIGDQTRVVMFVSKMRQRYETGCIVIR